MLLTLAEVKAHCGVDGNDHDTVLTIYTDAAEASAVEFIDRNVYADSTALTTAQSGAFALMTAATATHNAATTTAQALADEVERDAAQAVADRAYDRAREAYRRTMAGIVINGRFKAGVLLTVGHLFKNRESTISGTIIADIPFGVEYILQPLREYT